MEVSYVLNYIILSVAKILDNIILTAKSIATYKEQQLWSSILVVISQLLFYFLISEIIEDNSLLAILIVSISSGVGNYIAFTINRHFKKDAKWTIIITSSNVDDIRGLCDFLSEKGIKYIVNDGYNRSWKETMHVLVFSKSKEESRLIDSYLSYFNSKYLKEVI
jgi:ABC-type iron transport system FetAB permease component